MQLQLEPHLMALHGLHVCLTKGPVPEYEIVASKAESGDTAMHPGCCWVVVDRYLMGR